MKKPKLNILFILHPPPFGSSGADAIFIVTSLSGCVARTMCFAKHSLSVRMAFLPTNTQRLQLHRRQPKMLFAMATRKSEAKRS